MGKDWLPWIGGGSRQRRRRMSGEMREAAATSGGCLRAVSWLFDFPVNQDTNSPHLSAFHSSTPEEVTITSKGLEAPRNSLESGEADRVPVSVEEEESYFNLPVQVGIQIKTGNAKAAAATPRLSSFSASKSRMDDVFSDSSRNSPGIRTPGVVARLMGLDLIPECNSPTVSSSSRHQIKSCLHQRKSRNFLQGTSEFYLDDISIGALSLPETPRRSSSSYSARRSDSEHHRLSLQINTSEQPSARPRRFRLQQLQDENSSPGRYAKQIVKQVKERISRRVGLDITNTGRNGDHTRRDENLIPLKFNNKNPKNSITQTTSPNTNQSATQSLKPITGSTRNPRISTAGGNHLQGIVTNQLNIPSQQKIKDRKKDEIPGNCSSSGVKNMFTKPAAVRTTKQEAFVHSTAANKTAKKCKKTPLPSEIFNKKDTSPPLTKLPQKQLFRKQSHPYSQPEKRLTITENVPPDSTSGRASAQPSGDAATEYGDYIRRILELAGFANNNAALTSAKWYIPSHPIDPLIFHRLELLHLSAAAYDSGGGLSSRCNRKLIFQLVDEQLAEILKSYFNRKPCSASKSQIPLAHELCRRIAGFPAANCAVLEDIDSLIDGDLRRSRLDWLVEEEGETIVREIEGEIVERLVLETLAAVGCRRSRGGDRVTL